VPNEQTPPQKEALNGAFFWLSAFYLVYCARPEDWIPGLHLLPLAKISGILAIIGFIASVGKTRRGLRDLPIEAKYLLAIIALLFPSALLSPVWKGGAFFKSLDFAKVYVAWVLTFLLVTNFSRLKRLVFVQAGSVAAISAVSVLKGRSHARLEGVLGGIYSNPNDLAFAIVLSLPFCLAFLLSAKGAFRKIAWAVSMLLMAVALFLTASRGGFVTLVVAGVVCLWHFGVRGRRLYLIFAAALAMAVLLAVAGDRLKDRFFAISGQDLHGGMENSAYGSYEERQELMMIAVHGVMRYPILGIGMHNFPNYSGKWRDVHVAYLQIAVEGGIPILILYLLFFWRSFANLRFLGKIRDLDRDTKLLVAALHSSLVGFVVGACFSPEAYQYFPYFTVGYTSVLVAIVRERQRANLDRQNSLKLQSDSYASDPRTNTLTFSH
jgi:hypothetical protein